MFPTGGDPRQLQAMMKRFGINVRDIPNVQEVIVRTADLDYVFTTATVSVMEAQGVETWQVSGNPERREHATRLVVSDDDVAMVVDQTGCDAAAAREALEATGGDLAEAIMKLSG